MAVALRIQIDGWCLYLCIRACLTGGDLYQCSVLRMCMRVDKVDLVELSLGPSAWVSLGSVLHLIWLKGGVVLRHQHTCLT